MQKNPLEKVLSRNGQLLVCYDQDGRLKNINSIGELFVEEFGLAESITDFLGFFDPMQQGLRENLVAYLHRHYDQPLQLQKNYVSHLHKVKTIVWHVMYHSDDGIIYCLGTVSNESRQTVEAAERRLSFFRGLKFILSSLSDSNELIKKCLDFLVDEGGYKLAWFTIHQDNDQFIRPLLSSGAVSYLDGFALDKMRDDVRKGPTLRTLFEQRTTIVNSMILDHDYTLWRSKAQESGFNASISLNVNYQPNQKGLLMIYSEDENAFDADEVEMLEGFSANMAHALTTMWLRKQKDEVGTALEHSNFELSTFKNIFDNVGIVSITDVRGIITHVSDNFIRVSGYSRNELIGKTHRIVNAGYHDKTFFSDLWSTIRSGRKWEGTIRFKSADGSLRWMQTQIVPILDLLGKPIQFIAFRIDVSDLVELSTKDRFSTFVIQSTADAVVTFDENGIVHSWNKAAEIMYGYSAEQMVGQSVTILIPNNRLEEDRLLLERIKQGESIVNTETLRVNANGHVFPVLITASSIRDASGNIVGFSKIVRNIENQKNVESALRVSNDELSRKVKELNFIQQLSQALQDDAKPMDEMFRSLLQNVRDNFDEKPLPYASFSYGSLFIQLGERNSNLIQSRFISSEGKIGLFELCLSANPKSILDKKAFEWDDHRIPDILHDESPFFEQENILQMVSKLCCNYIDRNIFRIRLEQSEIRIKAMLEQSPVGYILLDDQRNVRYFNRMIDDYSRNINGISFEVGKNISELSLSKLPRIQSEIDELFSAQKSFVYNEHHFTLDNKPLFFEIHVDWIKNGYLENGIIKPYIVFSIIDITETKKLLLEKNRQLSFLQELSFITSHEIRHDYAKLAAMVDLVSSLSENDEEMELILSDAKNTFQRLNKSIALLSDKINAPDNLLKSEYIVILLCCDENRLRTMREHLIGRLGRVSMVSFYDEKQLLFYLGTLSKDVPALIIANFDTAENRIRRVLSESNRFGNNIKMVVFSQKEPDFETEKLKHHPMVWYWHVGGLPIDQIQALIKGGNSL
jgi:PAS domain S-box-containing protein